MILLVSMVIVSSAYLTWLERTERKLYGIKPGVSIMEYQLGGYLPEEVDPILEEMAAHFFTLPQNPRFDRETGRIIPESWGIRLNKEATKERLFAAPPNTKVKPVLEKIPPKHKAEELYGLDRVLGTFSTWVYGTWQRHRNVVLGALSINLQVVWPGETFSFNEVVGPRTPERGYRMAPVIGGDGLGIGGGVCQVSTTLYNAVLEAGLPVVERHPHSSRVPYVPYGKDATVVFGAQDFKFLNDRPYPVLIKAYVQRGRLTVCLMGR